MAEDWLESLDPQTRVTAKHRIARLQALGALDAESWIQSEIQQNIPQTARFLFLRTLWQNIDTWTQDSVGCVERTIAYTDAHPDTSFADAGRAMKRMLALGVSASDIAKVARSAAFDATFGVLTTLDGETGGEDLDDIPCWALLEVTPEGELTQREVGGLHESFLSLDPSGREGRPPDGE